MATTPKRILVITDHVTRPSYRLRVGVLVEPLKARGFDLVTRERPRGLLARWRLARSARDFDAVLLHKRLLDPWECRVLRRNARRVLYDVDDAVMYPHAKAGWLNRRRITRRYHATARVVDHVVAGNQYLLDHFASLGRAGMIIPTTVPPERYMIKRHDPTDAPRLVWIGTSGNLPYLEALSPALAKAKEQVPGLGLVVICDRPPAGVPVPVTFIPWSVEGEAAALVQGDIGIAPTPDDRWTLGKCGFKIIQYMAAGLPAVASPIGANAEIVVTGGDGATGFLPQDEAAWAAAIVRLARDADLRRRMGDAGRRRVEAHYALGSAVDAWETLLREARG